MSPKRSHSPGSMNPDRAREPRARGRTPVAAGGSRAGTGGLASGCGASRPALARGVPLRPARTWRRRPQPSERAAHPCAGPAGCGSGFSGSGTTPPRLPAPRRGWSCRAGPLNPGRTGGRLAGAGGRRRERGGPRRTQHSEGRGRRAPGAVGWGVGCAGGRDSCRRPRSLTHTHTRTYAHAHIHTHTHARALTSRPLPLRRCPGTCSPHPEIKGSAESCYLSSQELGEKPPFSVFT